MRLCLKFSVSLGILLIVLYTSACLFLFFRQNRFIFFPSSEISTIPTDLDMEYEEVWLPVISAKTAQQSVTERSRSAVTERSRSAVTERSRSAVTERSQSAATEKIHGWWIPAPDRDRITSADRITLESGRVLLYLHGNGDNISANLGHSQRFNQMGFAVFIIDYRGYGKSLGDFPTESTVYEDVETAWNYLVKQRGIAPEKIIIYGHSLGGAIAIELASRHPDAAGAIIECSFTSMRDMVDYQYPYFNIFPIDWLLTHHFDSINKVKSLKMPVLFTHGTDDRVVPTYMSQALYDATPEPKQLFIVPTADHNNVASVSGSKYFDTIRQFMKLVNPK